MSTRTVYVAMVADMLHAGHLNVLAKARELGEVIVGVLTDEAASTYKRLPFLPFSERKALVESVNGVSMVVAQETLSYTENLERFKPDFLVHGDDWRSGVQSAVRGEAIQVLSRWGGELIEVPYTIGISSTQLHKTLREEGILSRLAQQRFRKLLDTKRFVRLIEVHNAVSAWVAENASASGREFDGFWSSSLTDSTARGRPDIEVVDLGSRLSSLEETMEITSKPIIYDGDSGGNLDQTFYLARALSKMGVAGLCLEDKLGRKRNSLYGRGAEQTQTQAPIEEFCKKIRAAKRGSAASELMVIARIESLVLYSDCDQAIERAHAYCDAGADAILIHSVADSAREIFDFSRRFRTERPDTPLVAVPTAFDDVTATELESNGFNVVIYANHLLRAAYSAMQRAAGDILEQGHGSVIRQYSASARDLLALFPEPNI
jgi:phosphoenolpyruvate phosphomutase / 2-hydroxyethylphosphonate cytidylyltransferase